MGCGAARPVRSGRSSALRRRRTNGGGGRDAAQWGPPCRQAPPRPAEPPGGARMCSGARHYQPSAALPRSVRPKPGAAPRVRPAPPRPAAASLCVCSAAPGASSPAAPCPLPAPSPPSASDSPLPAAVPAPGRGPDSRCAPPAPRTELCFRRRRCPRRIGSGPSRPPLRSRTLLAANAARGGCWRVKSANALWRRRSRETSGRRHPAAARYWLEPAGFPGQRGGAGPSDACPPGPRPEGRV